MNELTHAPSMEQVLIQLVRLRTAVQEALASRFGPRTWQAAPNVRPFTRAAADGEAPPGAETVSLGTVYVDGAYPAQLWRPAADTVAEIGDGYGFDTLVIHQDGPDGIAFTGRHAGGHTYRFGVATTTVLSVRSGAAVWAGEPWTSAEQVMAAVQSPDQG